MATVYNVPIIGTNGETTYYSGDEANIPQSAAIAAQTTASTPPQATTPPSTSAPAPAPTPPVAPAPTPTPTSSTTTTPPVVPTTALQPGNTGDNVKALQDYLVSQGYMTQDQVNTGYGTYGPQTTAAVLALQQKLGVDNTTGPGYFGPKTLAAVQSAHPTTTATNPSGLTTSTGPSDGSSTAGQPTDAASTDKYAGLDPISKQVQMYTDAYSALGLGDIKTQYQQTLDDQTALNNELQGKIDDVNNNPWLSEGIRTTEITKLQDSYKTRLDTLTNLETLYDSLYKQGTAQVESIVSKANTDIAATNTLAQKQTDAAAALAKDNVVQSVGGRELLINKDTGVTVADLGPTTKSATASTGTAAERSANAVSSLQGLISSGQPLSDGTPVMDSNGFITPGAWKQLIAQAPTEGLTRAQFISAFGNSLYTDSSGKISSAYGLTPLEIKSITGALPGA